VTTLRKVLPYLISLMLMVPCAHAFNLRWLDNTPASEFTRQDWKLLEQTVGKALNESDPGDKLTWENPETGHSGSVSHIGPVERNGRTCIRLGIYNKTKRLSGGSVASFCPQEDGGWKMEGK
jgi:surface antigen